MFSTRSRCGVIGEELKTHPSLSIHGKYLKYARKSIKFFTNSGDARWLYWIFKENKGSLGRSRSCT